VGDLEHVLIEYVDQLFIPFVSNNPEHCSITHFFQSHGHQIGRSARQSNKTGSSFFDFCQDGEIVGQFFVPTDAEDTYHHALL
jgi:hypothetical protein